MTGTMSTEPWVSDDFQAGKSWVLARLDFHFYRQHGTDVVEAEHRDSYNVEGEQTVDHWWLWINGPLNG